MSTAIGIFTTILVTLTIISAVSSQAPSPAPASVSGGSAAPAPFSEPLGPSTPGPSAIDECFGPVSNMSDCLGYVQQGSNDTKPDKKCCPELAGLIESNPTCLCKLLGSNFAAQYGITINFNRAFKLPSICKISTPSVTLCSAVGYPVAAPPGLSIAPGAQPPAGLAASPLAGGKDGSGASSISGSAHAFIGGLAFSFLLAFF